MMKECRAKVCVVEEPRSADASSSTAVASMGRPLKALQEVQSWRFPLCPAVATMYMPGSPSAVPSCWMKVLVDSGAFAQVFPVRFVDHYEIVTVEEAGLEPVVDHAFAADGQLLKVLGVRVLPMELPDGR